MNRLPLFALVLLALVSLALGAHAWSNPAQAGTPITISPSGEIALEVDGTQELTLSLGAQPSGDVTVILVATDPAVVGLSAGDGDPAARLVLNFPSADWQTAQTVTLTGLAPGAATIARQVSGGGPPSYHVQRVQVGATVGQRVAPQDDCSGDSTTTCSIAAPTSDSGPTTATGEIEVEGDIDWFGVDLTAGKSYRLNLRGKGGVPGWLNYPKIAGLHDASGRLIPGTVPAASRRADQVTFWYQASRNGVHYLAVAGPDEDNRWLPTGSYTLTVSETPADDFVAGPSTTGVVAVGSSITGAIQWGSEVFNSDLGSDTDWIRVDLIAGKTYRFTVAGAGEGPLAHPYLGERYLGNHLFYVNAAGEYRSYLRIAGHKAQETTAKVNRSGTFYITASASGNSTGTYTLTVVEVTNTVDDFPHDATTTGTVTAGPVPTANGIDATGATTGEIESEGDVDWFAVALEAGKSYLITQSGSVSPYFGFGSSPYTLSSPWIEGIYDAGGNRLDRCHSRVSGDCWVTFQPGAGGTYYVAATSHSYTGGSAKGTYRVAVNLLPEDGYTADTTTTGTLVVGGTVSGVIGTNGDVDWFAATLTAGESYVFELDADFHGGAAPYYNGRRHHLFGFRQFSNVRLGALYDADGSRTAPRDCARPEIHTEDYTNCDYRLSYTPAISGTYYIALGGDAVFGPPMLGPYMVTLKTAANATRDDFSADVTTTGSVTLDTPATGSIESIKDRDWFRVSLPAGNYRFEATGVDLGKGPLPDPWVRRFYAADGSLLSLQNPRGGCTNLRGSVLGCERFPIDAAGVYYIEVSNSRYGTGGYQLWLKTD